MTIVFIHTGRVKFVAALKSITYRPTDEVLEADEVLELEEGVEDLEGGGLVLEEGREDGPREVYLVSLFHF